jgi:hypothetical protein
LGAFTAQEQGRCAALFLQFMNKVADLGGKTAQGADTASFPMNGILFCEDIG